MEYTSSNLHLFTLVPVSALLHDAGLMPTCLVLLNNENTWSCSAWLWVRGTYWLCTDVVELHLYSRIFSFFQVLAVVQHTENPFVFPSVCPHIFIQTSHCYKRSTHKGSTKVAGVRRAKYCFFILVSFVCSFLIWTGRDWNRNEDRQSSSALQQCNTGW